MRVSPETRALFADFCRACVPRTKVDRFFRAEGFVPADSTPGEPLAESFQRQLDWSDGRSVKRALHVYQSAIDAYGHDGGGALSPKAAAVLESCQRDGLAVSADGAIDVPHHIEPDVSLDFAKFSRLSAAEQQMLSEHLGRIENGLAADPAAAIASSKELLESVCRIILASEAAECSRRDGVPALYKQVAKILEIRATAVPESQRGGEAVNRALQSLVQTVHALCELRNQLGLGHGKTRSSPAQRRHGRLAFDAARTVTSFLLLSWDDFDSRSEAALTTG